MRPPRRAILPALILSLALLVSITWRPAQAQLDAPAGCQEAYGATNRGGSTASPAVGGGGCNPFRRNGGQTVRVERVIDGDTIVVSGGQRVRYTGIDTPEVGQDAEYFGEEATAFNRRLLASGRVTLEKDVSDKDRFGRLLRYVYADGILVNAELVREGYARAHAFPPDTSYAPCLSSLEQEAREASRGMWGDQ